jgi:hypothetical protein
MCLKPLTFWFGCVMPATDQRILGMSEQLERISSACTEFRHTFVFSHINPHMCAFVLTKQSKASCILSLENDTIDENFYQGLGK